MAISATITLRAAAPDVTSWRDKPSTTASAAELPPKQAAIACQATAEQLVEHGHLDAAIGLFERARQLDAKRAKVARELAVLYDQAGADARALAEYQRALKETPKDPNLLNDLGYFYLSRGDASQAEKWFRAVLNRVPDHAIATGNLALALAEQGRYDEAYELFAQVTSPAAAHSNIGVIRLRHGDIEGAKQSLGRALDLDRQIQPAKATLAYLAEHVGASK
jgi:Tfp pilus assembly protein PilF